MNLVEHAFRNGEGLSILRFYRQSKYYEGTRGVKFIRFCIKVALQTSRRCRSEPEIRAEALGRAWQLRKLMREHRG